MNLVLIILAMLQASPECGTLTVWSWNHEKVFRCDQIDPRDGMPAPGACCCSESLVDHCLRPFVAGPDRLWPAECQGLDLNRDGFVDLVDIAALQLSFVP